MTMRDDQPSAYGAKPPGRPSRRLLLRCLCLFCWRSMQEQRRRFTCLRYASSPVAQDRVLPRSGKSQTCDPGQPSRLGPSSGVSSRSTPSYVQGVLL
jgi:hypothetical protein